MDLNRLKSAVKENDLSLVKEVLLQLDDGDLRGAFNLSATLIGVDRDEIAFEILLWVSGRKRPTDKDSELAWLRAMNNGCLFGIKNGTKSQKMEMMSRAMEVAHENISIYQNVAGVYCSLGQAEEAMDAIVCAYEAGYKGMMSIAEDPDLELISEHPGFKTLIDDALSPEKAELDKVTKNISKNLFGGNDVPDDLIRFWRAQLYNKHNEHTRESPFSKLYEESCSEELLDQYTDSTNRAALSMLLGVVDIVAMSRGYWIGYYRGHSREIAPKDALCVRFCCDGYNDDVESAASLSKLLASCASSTTEKECLHRVFNNNFILDVPFDRVTIRDEVLSSDSLSAQSDEFTRLVAPLLNSERDREEWDDDERTLVYFPSKVSAPWKPGDIMRIGGCPIGVSRKLHPEHQGEPMQHLFTLDLRQVGFFSAERPDLKKFRALSVFVSGLSTSSPSNSSTLPIAKMLLLTQVDIDLHGEGGDIGTELPRNQWSVVPISIPDDSTGTFYYEKSVERMNLSYQASIGSPAPTHLEDKGDFWMAFDNSILPIEHKMYIFSSGIVFEER